MIRVSVRESLDGSGLSMTVGTVERTRPGLELTAAGEWLRLRLRAWAERAFGRRGRRKEARA